MVWPGNAKGVPETVVVSRTVVVEGTAGTLGPGTVDIEVTVTVVFPEGPPNPADEFDSCGPRTVLVEMEVTVTAGPFTVVVAVLVNVFVDPTMLDLVDVIVTKTV